MLKVGLADQIAAAIDSSDRVFVDLFAGAGSVAHWVAENHKLVTQSVDTQLYSAILCSAIIERTQPADCTVLEEWLAASRKMYEDFTSYLPTHAESSFMADEVHRHRRLALDLPALGPIARHYGGHYYSLKQAVALDCLGQNLPMSGAERSIAQASIIEAASMCAASPGHTAQPFQPTSNLLGHIEVAWGRDPFVYASRHALSLASRHALAPRGRSFQSDALDFIKTDLTDKSVVFCDPPYSEVQYSRFYHVLEGVARGGWPSVSGAGRAPDIDMRFASSFSAKGGSRTAFENLFSSLAMKSATVVLTFPNHSCSNGQSASTLAAMASRWFSVSESLLEVNHSSLGASGGGTSTRRPRRSVQEAVLTLRPL